MTEWKAKISGCFGISDRIFAGHANDEERAFDLLTTLRSANIGWAELEAATRSELSDCDTSHVDNQIKKMSKSMKFWLLD